MKEFSLAKSPPVYVEINDLSLKAFKEGNPVELPLERGPDGRLTAACREKITAGLRVFAGKKTLRSRVRAFCAVRRRRCFAPPAGFARVGKGGIRESAEAANRSRIPFVTG